METTTGIQHDDLTRGAAKIVVDVHTGEPLIAMVPGECFTRLYTSLARCIIASRDAAAADDDLHNPFHAEEHRKTEQRLSMLFDGLMRDGMSIYHSSMLDRLIAEWAAAPMFVEG